MTDVAVSEVHGHLAKPIDDSRRSSEPAYVTRRGSRIAVLVDAEVYGQLVERAEDASDRAELRAARAEDDYVPWEDVMADLGLA